MPLEKTFCYSTTEIKGIIFLVTLLKLDSDNAYSLKKNLI
jgi:hypothetical protein